MNSHRGGDLPAKPLFLFSRCVVFFKQYVGLEKILARDLIKKAVDIVQPDTMKRSGCTDLVKIAAIASVHHIPFSPHGRQHYPLSAHILAALGNGLMIKDPPQDQSKTEV